RRRRTVRGGAEHQLKISLFKPPSAVDSDQGSDINWDGMHDDIRMVTQTMMALVVHPVITNTSEQLGSIMSSGVVCAPIADAEQPGARDYAMDSIPENYLELYQEAGEDRGVPWNILAGIGQVESHHGRWDGPGITEGHNDWGAAG